MGIVEEDIVRVREQTDIVGLITQYTQLKRVGSRQVGLCPFHSEKSPSFSVNTELNLYKCFGCGVSGDVITFVREMEHLDFVGAVEQLASKAGVVLRYTDKAEGEGRKRKTVLTSALESAVEWYHQRLLTSPDAGGARRYLRDRGFTGEQVRRYKIGWAPDDWDLLCKALGAPRDVLVDSGLGMINRRDRLQDFFRARVLFPIFDERGDPVSFGGRIMPGATGPKYLNTSETSVYRKSRTLYGLNWHKTDIVADDQIVVCEGYTDVIGLAEVGIGRGVATCGTALTDDHVRTMKKFATTLVLAFDADAAGQAAADRVYAWEQEHELDVRVAAMPGGGDPADLALSDPAALVVAIDEAQPFLGYRVDRVLATGELGSIEGRARAAETAISVISEHPSDFVRDQYVMTVASGCQLDPDLVRRRLAERLKAPGPPVRLAAPVRRPPDPATEEAPQPADPFLRVRRHPELERIGRQALALVIQRRDEVTDLFTPGLFLDPLHAAAFKALGEEPDVHTAMEMVPASVADLIARCAVIELDEPMAVLTRLVDQTATAHLRDLLTGTQGASRDERSRMVHWAKARVDLLRRDHVDLDALFDLRDWLDERSAANTSRHAQLDPHSDPSRHADGTAAPGVGTTAERDRSDVVDRSDGHETGVDPPGAGVVHVPPAGELEPLPDESMMSDAAMLDQGTMLDTGERR